METVSGLSNWKLVIRREPSSITILQAVTCDPRAVLPEELFDLPRILVVADNGAAAR